jgi:hypothetical protein
MTDLRDGRKSDSRLSSGVTLHALQSGRYSNFPRLELFVLSQRLPIDRTADSAIVGTVGIAGAVNTVRRIIRLRIWADLTIRVRLDYMIFVQQHFLFLQRAVPSTRWSFFVLLRHVAH